MRLTAAFVAALLALAAPTAGWAAPAAKWVPPRAADGHADLSGVWSNASVTKLTRLPGTKTLAIGEAEAKALAASNPMTRRLNSDSERTT